MANAVENSLGVLMCMTENYKQSANCRAEAEYAFQLGKPIIPLIMQKGFKADGWLGIIMGSKIFIDFTKYEFDVCIKKLLNETTHLKQPTKKESSHPTHTSNPIQISSQPSDTVRQEISNWTETEVMNWLNKKEINASIIENIMPCNGTLLDQYHDMQVSSPEFFYSSLSSNKTIPFRDVAIFGRELKKLFS